MSDLDWMQITELLRIAQNHLVEVARNVEPLVSAQLHEYLLMHVDKATDLSGRISDELERKV